MICVLSRSATWCPPEWPLDIDATAVVEVMGYECGYCRRARVAQTAPRQPPVLSADSPGRSAQTFYLCVRQNPDAHLYLRARQNPDANLYLRVRQNPDVHLYLRVRQYPDANLLPTRPPKPGRKSGTTLIYAPHQLWPAAP